MERLEFDCHGMTYFEVEDTLPNWLLINQYNQPFDIITGASEPMKNLVKTILDKYQFRYTIPIFNYGMIIVN